MDLLLANKNDLKAKEAFQFISSIATGRSDVEDIKKGKRETKAILVN